MTEPTRDQTTENEQKQPETTEAQTDTQPVEAQTDQQRESAAPQPSEQDAQPASEQPVEGKAQGDEPRHPQGKTWYPYITKTQFEKFLSRLENKMPEQIDRDYVRAIIRTPSMIYRFLRGIEAMRLIDREQATTDRLERLVDRDYRRFAIAEILRDLYGDLLTQWQDAGQTLSDDDMVDFFRARTGMGRDSANKMKMFFKYLLSEADFGEPPEFVPKKREPQEPVSQATAQDAGSAEAQASAPSSETAAETSGQPIPAPEPAAAQDERQQESKQDSDHGQGTESERSGQRREASTQRNHGREAQQQRNRGRDGRDSRESGRENSGGRDNSRERESTATREAPAARDTGREVRGAQPQRSEEQRQERTAGPEEPQTLSEVQRAYLQTLQSIVRVNVDGDWDEEMIKAVFERLERLFDRIRRSSS